MAGEDGDGAIIVLHVQGLGRVAAWTGQETVATMDVDFRHKQSGEELRQFGGAPAQFYDNNVARGKRDAVQIQKILRLLGVTYNDADNGAMISRSWRSLTMPERAPTLLGRKMENCLTLGPEIFSVVLVAASMSDPLYL